ncbi:MAG TPA: DUF1330 domain-containing protein [bacterium]|nr:DUF1330 domain-containing protein [bacterium]
MPAYVIVDTKLKNPEPYEEYKAKAAPAVAKYGGRYLVRGGSHSVIEGAWNPTRVVVLEFPSRADFDKFYNSPEYQSVIGIRHANADTDMVVVEGV